MKKIILFLFLVTNCYSQYKICYDYSQQTADSFGTSKTINKCYLYTDNKQSKFIKDRVINGEYEQEFNYPKPDLEEKFKAENKANVFGDSIGYVVTKFLAKDSLYLRSQGGVIFKEYLKNNFIILEEFKNIYNYKCQKATTSIYGREFELWFTTDIPVSDGPWKLSGLPGLIIEAHSKDKFHNFFMTSIKKLANDNYIYKPTPFREIGNREKRVKSDIERIETDFKYRKSKHPNAQIKNIIVDLDLPQIVFE
jgi:GLPGLI family protein